jgi:hypothetical protein
MAWNAFGWATPRLDYSMTGSKPAMIVLACSLSRSPFFFAIRPELYLQGNH